MLANMVEDVEGCYVGVKHLGIAKVANPRVIYNSLDKSLDAALSGLRPCGSEARQPRRFWSKRG
jgi:hypothetical protein